MEYKRDEIWTLHKVDLSKFNDKPRCLDGSPGGFWFLPGYDSGSDKFLIHHQGGGWCINQTDCFSRSQSQMGSSSTWEEISNCTGGSEAQPCSYDGDEGLQASKLSMNPFMYNWNKVYLGYCDGASFAGSVEAPVYYNETYNLYYRGQYIIDAIYDTLLSEYGMNTAKTVVISGTSAGGLSVYIHADYLNQKITRSNAAAEVLAVPDAGYFMDLPSITGVYLYTPNYQNVFAMQNVSLSVNRECIAFYAPTNDTWRCFMAQYTLPFIETRTFIVNSLVDNWQGYYIMGITCDPTEENSCDQTVIDYLDQFREDTLKSLESFLNKKGAGAWLVECWTHPLVNWQHYWQNVTVEGESINGVFRNWLEGNTEESWVKVDGKWGSNTC